MIVIGDVIIGLGIAALVLLNVYQFGKVCEERAINAAYGTRLAKAEVVNKDNAEKLVDLKKPVLITMTEQQVMGLASMLQAAFETLHPGTALARKPN